MQLALESCSLESTGRLLESVSDCRSRWMVIRSQERQDPAYRATLLPSRWAQLKTLITFLIYLKQFVTLPISNSL